MSKRVTVSADGETITVHIPRSSESVVAGSGW